MTEARARRRYWIGPAVMIVITFAVLGTILLFSNAPTPSCTNLAGAIGKTSFPAKPCQITDADHLYAAHLETSLGSIQIVMDPRAAPKSVNNFVFLARAGYYNGTTFHRIDVVTSKNEQKDHALVQGGDRTGTGRGNAGYTFIEKATPQTRYVRGVAAMASSTNKPGENGSQFFIVVRDYEDLAFPVQFPTETFFGIVPSIESESFATLDRIAAVPLDGTRPKEPVRLLRITIEEVSRGG